MIEFPRYLAAKKTVDDRALNRFVWEQLRAALAACTLHRPLQVLELGCGIGTMVERLLAWDLAENVIYRGLDAQAENIEVAEKRVRDWAEAYQYRVSIDAQTIALSQGERSWQVCFQHVDATTFQAPPESYDLLIANAFLDLMDVPRVLSGFARWLRPGGLFYFTINFDGGTIFEPVSDETREEKIMTLYHQSMDDRQVAGQPSGDSRTGRHLFHYLKAAGGQILAAGASDWVVHPGSNGYLADEAYFLHCILDFFESTLKGHVELGRNELEDWLTERRAQIQRAELTYIAHQLDFMGTFLG